MSLTMLLGAETAAGMLTAWPDKPFVGQLPDASPLGRRITDQTLHAFIGLGCVPADHVNVYKDTAAIHPSRFVVDGRLSPAAAELLLGDGCTIQMREIDRWYPPLAAIVGSLHAETGCPSYVSGFVTPPGGQGLDYHWDQYLGIVVQLAGSKTWELFRPKVDAPHRDHAMSTQLWRDEWVTEWQAAGPDMTVEMTPGQVLVLPRGWVHNPHARNATAESVHLTFVLKERSPLWVAERLVASAINDSAFRAVVTPEDLHQENLPALIGTVRTMMVDYLGGLDAQQMAAALRNATEKESSRATP